jgi:hypothetical protein
VLLFLLRWIYAPHQRRYLLRPFLHGICFTNHQTPIVAAMGIEAAIAAADFRMGRYLWLGNSIIYLAGLLLKSQHMLTALDNNQAIFTIFNDVGLCSIAAYIWFAVLTNESFQEFCLDASLGACVLLLAAIPAQGGFMGILALAPRARGQICPDTENWGGVARRHYLRICWIIGASFTLHATLRA